MKFNVVIGNPPYNRGVDIDFVNLSYEMCTDYCVMITPAKWQTADANQKIASKMSYGEFRKKIVPHMSKVVFYPDCYDLFAISQPDGITYYLIDKNNLIDKCSVTNKCITQNIFNSSEYRDIKNRQTLFNIGNQIIEYMGNYNRITMHDNYKDKYHININKQLTVGGGGFATRELGDDGHWHVRHDIVGNGSMLFSKSEKNLTVLGNPKIITNDFEVSGSSINIFSSDSLDACKSFYSYINCKLIRFLLFMNISSLACIGISETWRFVPAPTVLDADGNRIPGKFDHIYTDEELYNTFNLPQKYIDVIEAVIKERK